MGGGKGRPATPDYGPMAAAQRYAADLQYKAAQENMAAWKSHMEQTRQDFTPWREHGAQVMAELAKGIDEGAWDLEKWGGTDPLPEWNPEEGKYDIPEFDPSSVNLEEDPGYKFRLEEGLKAVRRGAAAGSGARSGATMKALTRYGQGAASQEYGAAYDRAVGRYQMDRQNILTQRGLDERDYGMNMERALAQRGIAVQDYGIRAGELQRQFGNRFNIANMGLNATAQGAGLNAQATGAMAQQNAQGAAATGAGEIGASQAMINQTIAANNARQTSFNNLMQVVGVGTGIATALSDRRVKRDIHRIGTAKNGLPIYRFRFVGSSEWQTGFMADEVERVHPEAVTEHDGIKVVNYTLAEREAV